MQTRWRVEISASNWCIRTVASPPPPSRSQLWFASSCHNSNSSVQSLMTFAVRLRDDWRMIWVTFGHVKGLDLVSGCGLIYKSGCNLKHHEIVAGVKGRWAIWRFYNSKAVSPGPGPRPDSERAAHPASLCRNQLEPCCKAEEEFIVFSFTKDLLKPVHTALVLLIWPWSAGWSEQIFSNILKMFSLFYSLNLEFNHVASENLFLYWQ